MPTYTLVALGQPPAGYHYLTDEDGAFLTDPDTGDLLLGQFMRVVVDETGAEVEDENGDPVYAVALAPFAGVAGTVATFTYLDLNELEAQSGAVAVTGASMSLTLFVGVTLIIEDGEVAVDGASANLIASRLLTAQGGSVAVSKASASLLSGRLLTASDGAVAVTGADVDLTAYDGLVLTTQDGAVAITGTDAALVVGRYLGMVDGTAASEGASATFTWIAAPPEPSGTPFKPDGTEGRTSREIDFLTEVRRADPDWQRDRRRELEYSFTGRDFYADPAKRGAYAPEDA